jgi:hypothetical protein
MDYTQLIKAQYLEKRNRLTSSVFIPSHVVTTSSRGVESLPRGRTQNSSKISQNQQQQLPWGDKQNLGSSSHLQVGESEHFLRKSNG